MKTLEQIINNAKYKRINGALVNRSVELAEKLRSAMESADLDEIKNYEIRTLKANSGFEKDILCIRVTEYDKEGYPYHEYRSLEDLEDYYFFGDFTCPVKSAKGKDRIAFLNEAKSIFDEIDKEKEALIASYKL